MRSFQLLTVLQILGFSYSLPVIHNPLTKIHDSRIYFHNAVNPFGKFATLVPEFDSGKNFDRFLRLGNVISYNHADFSGMDVTDERIHFPGSDPHARLVHDDFPEIGTRQFINDASTGTGESESIVFEQEPERPESRSQTRFRHALKEEIEHVSVSTSTVGPTQESFMTRTKEPEKKEPVEKRVEEIHRTVPLSFLERWAQEHSMPTMRIAENSDKRPPPTPAAEVDESPIIFDDGDNKDKEEGSDKSFSFQSFLQIPRLDGQAGGCPPNHFRNHRGKCVKPIRIVVIEAEESEER